MRNPPAPPGLQAPGKRFWKKKLDEVVLSEAHDLERLRMACKCLDEISEAEETVKTEGRFIKDRWQQVKEHPACKSIRDTRIIFCRIIRELSLDLDTGEDSRPPKLY